VLRSHRWRTVENSAAYLIPHLAPGTSILDVGCGPGTITADLARRVAPAAVIGIDLAAGVVAAARDQHAQVPNLRFETGDVYALDFPDAAFDVVYAHQVLQHLSDPVRALREMRRVLRPGGTLAVRDSDYAAFVWSPADERLDRWMSIYHALTRRNHAEADAGRYLHVWVREAGFKERQVSSSNWTFQTDEERAWWGDLWADRVRHSEFARQALEYGLADQDDLDAIAAVFHRWRDDPDGLFIVVHGEVIAHP
jgi:ubiquinone/menaquinone biosynthesis C-methylase UbiE